MLWPLEWKAATLVLQHIVAVRVAADMLGDEIANCGVVLGRYREFGWICRR